MHGYDCSQCGYNWASNTGVGFEEGADFWRGKQKRC